MVSRGAIDTDAQCDELVTPSIWFTDMSIQWAYFPLIPQNHNAYDIAIQFHWGYKFIMFVAIPVVCLNNNQTW